MLRIGPYTLPESETSGKSTTEMQALAIEALRKNRGEG
jgi:hypothetical protein